MSGFWLVGLFGCCFAEVLGPACILQDPCFVKFPYQSLSSTGVPSNQRLPSVLCASDVPPLKQKESLASRISHVSSLLKGWTPPFLHLCFSLFPSLPPWNQLLQKCTQGHSTETGQGDPVDDRKEHLNCVWIGNQQTTYRGLPVTHRPPAGSGQVLAFISHLYMAFSGSCWKTEVLLEVHPLLTGQV